MSLLDFLDPEFARIKKKFWRRWTPEERAMAMENYRAYGVLAPYYVPYYLSVEGENRERVKAGMDPIGYERIPELEADREKLEKQWQIGRAKKWGR